MLVWDIQGKVARLLPTHENTLCRYTQEEKNNRAGNTVGLITAGGCTMTEKPNNQYSHSSTKQGCLLRAPRLQPKPWDNDL